MAQTVDIGLIYYKRGKSIQLGVYCDAANACQWKSSSKFVVLLNGCCGMEIKATAYHNLSTTESGYIALNHGVKECIGLKKSWMRTALRLARSSHMRTIREHSI